MRKLPAPRVSPYIPWMCGLGNLLELFDYTLYGVLLGTLSRLFFPHHDPQIAMMIAMASFALSFFLAPFGALLWGWVGDRFGRRNLLTYSLIVMALPSFFIACLPTYAMIGGWAPVLLLTCRILQVMSASGEVKGAKIFAMEHAGESAWGRVSGIISACGAGGVMLAMVFGLMVTTLEGSAPGAWPHIWRLPFLCASLLGVVSLFIRRNMAESPEFVASTKKEGVFRQYLSLNRQHPTECLTVFILGGFLGEFSYAMHACMNHLLIQHLQFHPSSAFMMAIAALLSTAGFALLSGRWVDRYGAQPVMHRVLSVVMCLFIPTFAMIQTGIGAWVLLAHFLLGALLGSYAATSSVIMLSAFPAALRCRGVLFYYALGVGLFGGITPLLFSWIATLPFGFYGISVILTVSAWMVWQTQQLYCSKGRRATCYSA